MHPIIFMLTLIIRGVGCKIKLRRRLLTKIDQITCLVIFLGAREMHEKLNDLGWVYYSGEIHIIEPETEEAQRHV